MNDYFWILIEIVENEQNGVDITDKHVIAPAKKLNSVD